MNNLYKSNYRSKANSGLEDQIKTFKTKYLSFVLKYKKPPKFADCMKFGLEYEDLDKVFEVLRKNRKIYTDKSNGRLVLKGYETVLRARKEKTDLDVEAAVKPKHDKLLSNPFIMEYLSKLSKNSDDGTNSVEAIDIIKKVNSNPYATDEDIAKLLEKEKSLSEVRRHLTELYFYRILSYERERDEETGWLTYRWVVNPKGLKKSYISSMKKRQDALETMTKENEKGRFFCERDGTHPASGFDDAMDEGRYKCEKCGSPLVFRTGEELAEPIKLEISELKRAIEEVKRIKV